MTISTDMTRDRTRGELRDPVTYCRCGAWRRAASAADVAAWNALHTGPGHRVVHDGYRADCKPMGPGCRQCGEPTTGRLHYYCSVEHREQFEDDHFWNSARAEALRRFAIYDIRSRAYRYTSVGRFYYSVIAYICWRCGERIAGDGPEVNHIMPVNGHRPGFGCMNHQSNLEVLCHACHVIATAEQRAAGLFVKVVV